MERKETTTAARFNRSRAEGAGVRAASTTVIDFVVMDSRMSYRGDVSKTPHARIAVMPYRCYTPTQFSVLSQQNLAHYSENVSRHLPRQRVRQGRAVGGPRQLRG